jgi:pantetheine-phosphate adenylyltransferase
MQMFSVNHQLAKDIETIFLMSSPRYSFLSSSIVKEVARYKGDISKMVTPLIEEKLKEKFYSS